MWRRREYASRDRRTKALPLASMPSFSLVFYVLGPLVRLHQVREWSVKYDELNAIFSTLSYV